MFIIKKYYVFLKINPVYLEKVVIVFFLIQIAFEVSIFTHFEQEIMNYITVFKIE